MEITLACTIGILYSSGIYLLLRRSLTKLILGIILFSHATNLLVFMSAGLTANNPPFIAEKEVLPSGQIADPLPQALVLTAIVISLGVTAFTLILKYKYHQLTGYEDFDKAKETDQ